MSHAHNHHNIEPKTIAEKVTSAIGSIGSLVVHTIIFASCFIAIIMGANASTVMLVLTTIVSLEAIYLSILIQMSVNRSAQKLEIISEDVEDIQEDVEEISEDVEEIQKDVDEIQKDVDEIQEDVEDIQEDVDEIQKDVDEISEDVDDLTEEKEIEDLADEVFDTDDDKRLSNIENALTVLIKEVQALKKANSKTETKVIKGKKN